jgi:hypothetical protein
VRLPRCGNIKSRSTDGRATVQHACLRKGVAADALMKTLDALAVELGKLAAERDFAISAQDNSPSGGLSLLEGRIP